MVTLFMVGLLGFFLFAYLYLVRTQRGFVSRSQAWNHAMGMAEAGVEEAFRAKEEPSITTVDSKRNSASALSAIRESLGDSTIGAMPTDAENPSVSLGVDGEAPLTSDLDLSFSSGGFAVAKTFEDVDADGASPEEDIGRMTSSAPRTDDAYLFAKDESEASGQVLKESQSTVTRPNRSSSIMIPRLSSLTSLDPCSLNSRPSFSVTRDRLLLLRSMDWIRPISMEMSPSSVSPSSRSESRHSSWSH